VTGSGNNPYPGVVSVYDGPNFTGKSQPLPNQGVYSDCQNALTIGRNTISSVRVPPGMKVTLYQDCTAAGPAGDSVTLTADTPALPKLDKQAAAIVVERVGFQPPATGLTGQDYPCPSTTCPGKCCVPLNKAHEICRQDPQCKYVETGKLAPADSAVLRAGIRKPSPDWTSQEKDYEAPTNGKADDYACDAITTCPGTGKCCVPADKAHELCTQDPKCKFVGSTTDGAWLAANPDTKLLGTGDVKPVPNWTSEKKSPPGSALPVALFTEPNFAGTKQEFPYPGIYTACKNDLTIGRNTASSVRVAPGFMVTLFANCDANGPSQPIAQFTSDVPTLDAAANKKVAAVAVERIGYNMPAVGQAGQDYLCESTSCTGKCCVPAAKAHEMCRKDPRCKYVDTPTTDAAWINANPPGSVALRTGVRKPTPGWNSEEKAYDIPVTGLIGEDYPCNGSTCPSKGCCLPSTKAYEACTKDPKCLYVETNTKDPNWNAPNGDSKALRTGIQKLDPNWSSEKKNPSIPVGPVLLYPKPDFQGTPQEILTPGLFTEFNKKLTIGKNNTNSVKVPPGWRVTVFKDTTATGMPAGDFATLNNSVPSVPKPVEKTVAAVVVERVGFDMPAAGQYADNYVCAGSGCAGDKACCVPEAIAHMVCGKDPKCKYVSTTTDQAWLTANPNMALLQTGTVKPKANWTAQPKKDLSFPETCPVGSSLTGLTKVVKVPAGTKVPPKCGPECRKNTDAPAAADIFDLAVDGTKLTVTLNTANSPGAKGWAQSLKVPCSVPDDGLGTSKLYI
jgi:hypothetical protein